MAWFSQSQISSYWYNLYGCFPDADEASVLSAFVYVYLLFEWALLSLNFRIYGRFQPQIDPYTIAKATVSHRICHFYQCGNIISAGFHRNSSAFDYISIPGCWDVTFLFQPYPSKRRDLNPVPFTKTVFGIISYKIHFYIWSSFFLYRGKPLWWWKNLEKAVQVSSIECFTDLELTSLIQEYSWWFGR